MPFGDPMKLSPQSSGGDTTAIDSYGYYLEGKDYPRLIYIEIDKNRDNQSDEMIWNGTPSNNTAGSPLKSGHARVHEESDTNYDGKVDTIRWFLVNDVLTLVQKDTNADGFFETLLYYNLQKKVARTDIDSNRDGKFDIFIFNDRAEVDTNADMAPDKVVFGKSPLELEEKATNKKDLKDLPKASSYFLNSSLVPQSERPIVGGF